MDAKVRHGQPIPILVILADQQHLNSVSGDSQAVSPLEERLFRTCCM